MLAGKIKLRTFLFALAGGLLLCGGAAVVVPPVLGIALFSRTGSGAIPADAMPVAAPVVDAPTEAMPAGSTTSANPATASDGMSATAAARDVDREMFKWVGKNLGSDKKKDVTNGSTPFKINLYQDAGSPTMNRAKVDLDRDEEWDEKWDFKDGVVTRKVAPGDDEAYSQGYRWDGASCVPE